MLLASPVLALADAARFDIPEQPLSSALQAFATQANMQLLYVYDFVAKMRGNEVRGDLDKHAALALLLAAIGLYGVISFTAARRTNEMGIRLALGARPVGIVRLVMGEGVALAGAGVMIGMRTSSGRSTPFAGQRGASRRAGKASTPPPTTSAT